MTAKDVIVYLMGTNDYCVNALLADLADEDILTRPAPGANHIAWQLGHVIEAEQGMLKAIPGAAPLELPQEWSGVHTAENSSVDPPRGFATRSAYLEWYKKSRDHVREVLQAFPDADLDKPVEGRLSEIAPTIGSLFTLIADHPMMHVGQFAVLRRKLGKPRVM